MPVADSFRFDAAARKTKMLAVVAATVAGLTWALPAAAIGLTLGFVALGTLLFPRIRVPGPLLLVVIAGCAAVAYLSATRDLGTGYRYIPAILPFFLLSLAISAVVHGPRPPGR